MTTALGIQPSPRLHHQVVDAGHHCNFSQVPHSLLDDVASGKLQASALVLYTHLLRISWEQHGQAIAESLRETQRRTRLARSTILKARSGLVEQRWITTQTDGQLVTIELIDRWSDNCPGSGAVAAAAVQPVQGGTTTCVKNRPVVRKNPARLAGKTGQFPVQNAHKTLKTLEDLTPQPPRGRGEEFFQDDAPTDAVPGSSAEALVDGLYRGLGVAPTTCTARRRKRELALAQDLVAVGATPAEAEAYARDSSNLPRRIAPVDMAAFERERPSWLARRRRPSDYDGPRFVVPTGPPPEQPPVDHAVWDRSMAKWMAERGRTWTPKNRTAI